MMAGHGSGRQDAWAGVMCQLIVEVAGYGRKVAEFRSMVALLSEEGGGRVRDGAVAEE
jgi:hypothetical protein